jgi:uncharacterized cupin superfamily protein
MRRASVCRRSGATAAIPERDQARRIASSRKQAILGPAAEVIVDPAPSCHSLNLFTDPSTMRAGVWDVMTPCERTFVNHRVHELMHLIEGEVTQTHRDGTQEVIRAGDTILIPRGAPYAWKSERPVIKYYAVL